jgi:hypothetical protein
VSNGVVYFGFAAYTNPGMGVLAAFNATTGAVKWKFTENEGDYCTPGVTNEALYVHVWNKTAGGGFCYAFPLEDPNGDGVMTIGDAIWSFQTLDVEGGSSPLVTDNAIIVGSNYNILFALNRTTGQQMWNITTRKSNVGSAAVWERKVYYGSKDGSVYCIGSSSDLVGMKVAAEPESDDLRSGASMNISCTVVDEAGNPVSGATVNFTVTAGNISMSNGSTMADGRKSLVFTAQPVKKNTTVTLSIGVSRTGMAPASTSVCFTVSPLPDGHHDPNPPSAFNPIVMGMLVVIVAAGISAGGFIAMRRRPAHKKPPSPPEGA